jgi:chitodextrinase
MSTTRSVNANFVADDTEPPTSPFNLIAAAASPTQINLSWNASTDNVGVDHYEIFRDGNKVAETSTLHYADIGLSPGTTYTYSVKAADRARNLSGASNEATATTLPGMSVIWPTAPPVQVCDNADVLTGPDTAPFGAVTVPAGDNSTFDFDRPDTTFWFAPGVHTLGNDRFSQIIPADNATFIGGPGSIIDGQNVNQYAFTQHAINVTIRYLTIRNFIAPLDEGVVNHDAGEGWTIEHNTVANNKGAGLMAGPNNTYRYNCIKDNGQYGINSCCGTPTNEIQNFVLDRNEIVGNNTDDWERVNPGCGCTGGVKFWINKNVTVTNNWIHNNRGVGLWLDNNNRGFVIESNYIADNDGQALMLEAGYDARVRYNNFKNNAIVTGREFQSQDDPFPIGAIYISEDGSPSGYGLTTTPMVISDNNFENNWGGVALWENADRYCSSTAHTHPPFCTIKIDLYNDTACETATENDIPNSIDKYQCRWSTENVIVENNYFRIDKAVIGIGCVGTGFCGISGIFSNYGTFPEFPGYEIPWRITFQQGNVFRNNHYFGDWQFAGFQTTNPDGSRVSWADWIATAPPVPPTFTDANRPTTFGQDQGSTYEP